MADKASTRVADLASDARLRASLAAEAYAYAKKEWSSIQAVEEIDRMDRG
jgi:hypothetical protein